MAQVRKGIGDQRVKDQEEDSDINFCVSDRKVFFFNLNPKIPYFRTCTVFKYFTVLFGLP